MKSTLLHKLKTRYDELAVTIRVLERELGPENGVKAMKRAAKAMNGNGHAPSLNGMPIGDAVVEALKAHGKPIKPKDLAELMTAGGMAMNPQRTSNALTRLKLTKAVRRTKRGWSVA